MVMLFKQRTLTLETSMQLERFPFDRQILKAYIIPLGYNSSKVQLEVNSNYKITVKDYVKD